MLKNSNTVRWMIVLHVAVIICLWVIPLTTYTDLPDRIPVHFDSQGEPNLYTTKAGWGFWALPLIATVIALVALWLIRYPHVYRHPRKGDVDALPEHLRPQVYVILQELLLAVFISVDLMILIVEYGLAVSTMFGSPRINSPLVFGFAAAPLLMLGYYLPRVSRKVDELKAQTSEDPCIGSQVDELEVQTSAYQN